MPEEGGPGGDPQVSAADLSPSKPDNDTSNALEPRLAYHLFPHAEYDQPTPASEWTGFDWSRTSRGNGELEVVGGTLRSFAMLQDDTHQRTVKKKPHTSRSSTDIAVKVTCLSWLVLNDREKQR